MEATSMSINRGMDKEDVVPVYNWILLGHKQKRNWVFAEMWMNLQTVKQSEVSQKEKTNIY